MLRLLHKLSMLLESMFSSESLVPRAAETAAAVQVLVEQLRQKCLEERVDKGGDAPRSYSALTQSPREWALEPGKPCGGERLLLMFDRWRVPPAIKGSVGSLMNYQALRRRAPAAHV